MGARVAINLDRELVEKFRKFVVEKHGKLHGALKEEVEKALLRHMGEI